MPLVGKLSDRVSNRLGLKDLPPPEKVIENLSVLKSKALEMANPDTDVDFKRQLHSIYKHMQDNVSVFVTMMGNGTCWLWTHNQFVAPQDLVLEYPNNLDLSSYIGKVPSEFLPYRTLFQKFGLRKVLSNEDILGILYSIQQTIEARQPPFASSSEVKVSIEILNWLWKEKKTVQDDIPVPIIAEGGKFTLKPRSTTLFCDVSKNGLKELNCREEEIYVIHEEIPKAAAEWLEIRFLSTHILDPEEIGIEQCGQSEPITMRIKNILKEYDEDSDIFKELIQNAEDAGADVCKFLVDFRVHRDAPESLIDHDMALYDKSSVLDQVYNINHPEFSHLSNDDMKEFQIFLQSGLSKSKVSQEYVRKLKSLPIFETTHGKRVRIDGAKVFILNIKYTVIFPDLFNLPTNSCIFLKHNSENYMLSQTLNIQVLDDLEYFMKFILPAVHQLTETQILHSLKLLLSLRYSLKQRETIISSLKTVKLIRSSQGRLEPASYYFDESVELYKQMLPHERFVPERFWSELCEGDDYTTEKAKQLVRELGMKHVVSADEIIHFAYQLESEAKVNRRLKDMKLKSSLLFREALNKACNIKIKDQHFLEKIADIKFIFPVMIRKELSNYHQPFAAEGTTVKIRGSLIDKKPEYQDLIWSSMPIIDLPVYTTQKLMQMMKNAGAHEEPPPNCVASNIRNICQSPCETDQLIKTRAKVFRSSYAYLQAKRFEGNHLAGLPVVLVEKDTKLMRPNDVCLSLSYDLDFRPYLYKITPEDAMYASFFQKIGVKNKATAEQYCSVLAAVYADSCDKQKLHSNQLRTVKRAVEQLFKSISAQGNETLLENVETLYLPAADGKLYPSSTLCYNDTVFETKRLEEALENKFLLLEKLSECHLGNDKYKHHQLLQLLPQKFQPKMLSEFTEERVVESKMQPCELGTGCEFIGWFAKHLSSRAFKYGFICLLREQLQGKITQEDASNICEKIFGSIQIICCKTLETTLWLDKQPLPKTDEETDVSVERGQQGCTFYLKHNDDMALKVINEVITTLTKEINALLGNRIASVHLPVLGQLLMCDDLQDVRKTLAKNQIRDSAETESSSFSPAAPGTEIPEEWHDCLDMNVLNNFEEGEYVGYSIDDKYIYAVIVEELPGHNGRYSWRYKIEVGEDEPIEVSCVDLFQFKREKKMLKPEENTCMELEPLTGAVPHSSEPSINSLPASVQEAKREIDKCLAEIWKLPEEERHKAIKRLYLRWHPDKNPDRQSLANEAFKYLQNRIDELSKPKAAGSTFSSRNTHFRGFYQQWNQEARYHRNSRERFSRGYRGFHSYNFWTHNENVPRPDREEARRWCRQARCDLNAAHKDTGGESTEWCLFKVHQVVEKSLIAACYKRNGQHPNSSSISATAAQVSLYSPQLRDLPEIVKNLQTLGVDPKRTQYPNCHPYPHIPNGQFRSENEMLALNKASELLNKIEAYVN
ncbi:sacsin-like [Pelmatolapia mariae]|uniref:sacsin-like n=1 Tax=Pelmatolapia mariae TaxID=158779 RepID=UPI003211F050